MVTHSSLVYDITHKINPGLPLLLIHKFIRAREKRCLCILILDLTPPHPHPLLLLANYFAESFYSFFFCEAVLGLHDSSLFVLFLFFWSHFMSSTLTISLTFSFPISMWWAFFFEFCLSSQGSHMNIYFLSPKSCCVPSVSLECWTCIFKYWVDHFTSETHCKVELGVFKSHPALCRSSFCLW